MKQKIYLTASLLTLSLLAGGVLSGCQAAPQNSGDAAGVQEDSAADNEAANSEATPVETPDVADNETLVTQATALLGKPDADAAAVFGTGEANKAGDRQVGTIYNPTLAGDQIRVFTTFSDPEKIEAVSIWLTSPEFSGGSHTAEEWKTLLDGLFGEPTRSDEKEWEWISDGVSYTLHELDGTLALYCNPQVGELQ